jgi:hypothetical protein
MNRQSAQIIHGAMVVGVVMIVVMFAVVRQVSQPEPLLELLWILRLIALANVVGVMVLARIFRSQLSPLNAPEDADAWWRAHSAPVLIIWALAEGAALLGAVFWLLTGDMPILVGVGGVSLMVLLANRPAMLLEVVRQASPGGSQVHER